VTLARLREGPVRAPGASDVAFEDLRFPTPSGRIEILSRDARTRWGVSGLPDYVEPRESLRGSEGDPVRFPLSLLTPNSKNRIHSQFGNLPSIRALSPRPLLAIHPIDARMRGIADGDPVRVFNARGSLELIAHLDHGLRPGCVCVHNGWWLTDGGAVNLLSKARETDMGFGAAFHENLVEVARS
jgi:anaerobic selenocysteine-containing dehydrogenase